MIYGDNPRKINESKAGLNDPLGLNTYTLVPDINMVNQYSNRYVYVMDNPIMYVDRTGNFVVTTTVLVVVGFATLMGTLGGFVGNYLANQNGITGWAKVGYIAGGTVIGGTIGAVGGYLAAPAVVSATGVGAVSVTGAGEITLIPASLLGQYHHVLFNPIIKTLNTHDTLSGLFQRAGSLGQLVTRISKRYSK